MHEDDAIEEIKKLEIYNIEYQDGRVKITSAHPGLLIGKHGEEIKLLTKYLKTSIGLEGIQKIVIVENDLNYYLYDFDTRGNTDY